MFAICDICDLTMESSSVPVIRKRDIESGTAAEHARLVIEHTAVRNNPAPSINADTGPIYNYEGTTDTSIAVNPTEDNDVTTSIEYVEVYNSDNPRPVEYITKRSTVNMRHGFIRKVYLILGLQLLMTLGIASLIYVLSGNSIEAAFDFVVAHLWVLYSSLPIFAFVTVTFACYPQYVAMHSYDPNALFIGY